MKRSSLLIAATTMMIGCGEPPSPPANQDLIIGTASEDASTFVPVEDGERLTLLPGAQGGFHVFVRVRLGRDYVEQLGSEWILKREARRADTSELVSRAEQRVTTTGNGLRMVPTDEDPDVFETNRTMLLFLCPTPVGIGIRDQMLRLEVTASSDGNGPGPQGTLLFQPECPESDQRVFCESICSG